MLGSDVCRAAADAGVDVIGYERARLDVTDAESVERSVSHASPDVVINCAAWTDVDGAESAVDTALAVNGAGAGNVARAAALCGAWTIHISTDYVFNGSKSGPYVESDPVAPLSVYGRSKLEGELAVARASFDRHTVVRCSWLFGLGGRCFPKTIIRLAAERDQLTVVDDQVGCPTFTGHLAGALLGLACGEPVSGLIHVAPRGECSWFEFATEIVHAAGLACTVQPGTTAELARPAPRPANSVLRSERAGAPALQDWREGLAEFMSSQVPAT